MRQEKRLIITIDGPAGAGKSTAAKLLARQLNYIYLDSGAIYRAIACWALKSGFELSFCSSLSPGRGDLKRDEQLEVRKRLKRLLKAIDLNFQRRGLEQCLFMNGEDISEEIRSELAGEMALKVSRYKEVREYAGKLLRSLGEKGGVVAEGRDMGSVVFKEAEVKFYLDADLKERGRRRFEELSLKGFKGNSEEIIRKISLRDKGDRERKLSPLLKPDQALVIDTTYIPVDEVIRIMVKEIKKIKGGNK